ncbi:hypothetical protein GA0070214_106337 [Micromonospora chaiyaphumensis]|uniref:Uncharacterized protein n=2 Tax=Micromonospora chaiyaphumensis TaxID=307119 RepID=A0A1C4XSZ3_9ACTN|nr:hypothetical protein GA0070214_106337 [Micromonospora chaiyaphumensis]
MALEAPLAQAAVRIRTAAQAKPSGFAGVALDDGKVQVYWKGSVPAEMQAVLDQESRKVPVRVRTAAWSAQEMDRAAAALNRKVRIGGESTVSSIGWSVRGTGLRATLHARAGTTPRLPDVGVPVTVVREPAPRTGAVKPSTDSPRTPARQNWATAKDGLSAASVTWPDPSRQDDTTPAWAGAHLINSNATGGNGGWQTRLADSTVADADTKWHCTSGFPVRHDSGAELMVVPSSCARPAHALVDPSGDAVNDTAGTSSGWYAPSSGVSLVKPKGGAEPFVYDGDAWTQNGWQIAAWESPIAGQQVCVSGAERGTLCDAEIGDEVGTRTASISNSQGGGDQAFGLTSLDTSYHSGPVRPNNKPYTLKDGSPCFGFDFLEDFDADYCSPYPLGPGDMGAVVYTIPANGPQTGVLVKGVLVNQHQAPDASPYGYDFVGIDKIAASFTGITALTVDNDQK